ncbi:hypothetical protein K466DRAFT_504748 [Polyporus arcularius HHB13444]|uniref:IMD domain-containing protein n=1 Tax=Polyporus arcularius HHB13444 TaxID=1314778 RepID=A0A5C3NRH6_9APHY|nr:hypothetical protein K466DRAFT_504748 [Polyporus arcularius HHB13444]
MSAPSGGLAERNEIHKSCKTLESVVNILNDYCEAANAIVSLQKKLAKALREAASVKCVAEIPANALNASATIFEAMAEVDSKFAKYADKECDSVSAEVKKWFKKLAKEERAHDDKIASANQKIKQAGQMYERKAKKNPRDAADEHTRYINLLSTLGPEVNREKYNHALLVTQKHTSTVYNLAASFSRIADGEWMRGCESVRRFSPTVGPLGQWKALCEGGWSGTVPPDLPEESAAEQSETSSQAPAISKHDSGTTADSTRELAVTPMERPAPEYSSRHASEHGSTSRAVTPSGQSPIPPPQYFPPTPAAEPPSTGAHPTSEPAKEADEPPKSTDGHSATLASLAAFPAPPTHFPIPRLNGSRFNSNAALPPSSLTDLSPESQDSGHTPFPRLSESPIPDSALNTPALTEDNRSPPTPRTELATPPTTTVHHSIGRENADAKPDTAFAASFRERQQVAPSYSQTSQSSHSQSSPVMSRTRLEPDREGVAPEVVSAPSPSVPSSYKRGDYMDDADFGVRRSSESGRARTSEPSLGKIVERNDTGKSTGTVVAALRDRYARQPGPSSPPPRSPPPRELPRLPTSVSSLANRYEPANGAQRQQIDSPIRERRRPSVEAYPRAPEPSSMTASSRYSGVPQTPATEEIALRRQRIEELEELELREREHELRMKERDIEQRARELERERVQLLNARGGGGRTEGYVNDGTRATGGPRVSTTQRPTIDTLQSRYPSSYSHSVTHLVPPSSSQAPSRQPSSQPSSPASQQPTDHASCCGCEACSASKYRTTPSSPRDMRPPEPPIMLRPEKPKGWIRRLSMPVMGNAFSLDSKKNGSNTALAGGGYRNSLAFAEEDGRLLQTDITGGIRNRSSTNVVRR